MNVVVDASVACKWYLDEPDSDKARKLVDVDDNAQLIAPDLILPEVGNVLWRRRLKNEITQAQADEAVRHLPGVLLLIQASELLARALEIAVALRHPIYDCFYAAAAERWAARDRRSALFRRFGRRPNQGGGEAACGADVIFRGSHPRDDATLRGFAFFANGVGRWRASEMLAPFAGAGLGFVRYAAEDVVGGGAVIARAPSATNFAFQIKTGLDAALGPNLSVAPEYRFIWIEKSANGLGSMKLHWLGANLKYAF